MQKRQPKVITKTDEDLRWSKGILGDSTPKSLVETMTFLNGLHFALCSGSEHHELTVNQLRIIKPDSNCKYYCIEYTETT